MENWGTKRFRDLLKVTLGILSKAKGWIQTPPIQYLFIYDLSCKAETEGI